MNTTVIYCQNCRSANSLKETFCQECGTRLLLVVFPNSLQYDTNHVPTFYEDHLLERISILELRVAQLSERLESAFFLIQNGFEHFSKHQNSYRAFLEIAKRVNPELAAALSEISELNKANPAKARLGKDAKRKKILSEIIEQDGNQNSELFTHLVEKGIDFLVENEEKQAFQMLERAALLSPQNVALHLFIAENLFRADKYAEAQKYLEKIYLFAPTNEKAMLLLGAIYADFAEVEKAKRLLSAVAENRKTEAAANLIWGMLAAFENNWSEAIAAFKKSSGENEFAETQYLIGCAYFCLRQHNAALANLQKAIELDHRFSDAYFMQSVIYRLKNDETKAEESLAAAAECRENGAQNWEFTSGKTIWNAEKALPFLHFEKKNARILSGGALRVLKFMRKMIYEAIS